MKPYYESSIKEILRKRRVEKRAVKVMSWIIGLIIFYIAAHLLVWAFRGFDVII